MMTYFFPFQKCKQDFMHRKSDIGGVNYRDIDVLYFI